MKVWDLHCDTMYKIREAARVGEQISFVKSGLHVNLDKMKRGDYLLQCMACYVNLEKEEDPLLACLELADIFYRITEQYPQDVMQVKSREDIVSLEQSGRIGLMLTVEEGGVCKDSIAVLRDLYRLGARMMTFTWNYENGLGYPNGFSDPAHGSAGGYGLKAKGFEFLEEMERLHMIPDVSHLSDQGILDVLRCAKRPFAASHSNARAICPHPRYLTDDMLRQMGNKGCLVGLNYYGTFLDPAKADTPDAPSRLDDMVRHARHIVDVGGEELLGLGSDFDGIDGELEISGADEMPKLAEALKQAGFTERQIEKIFYGNALRFFKDAL